MAMTFLCPKYGFSDRFAWELLAQQKTKIVTVKENYSNGQCNEIWDFSVVFSTTA
jgi:hypothetical protein